MKIRIRVPERFANNLTRTSREVLIFEVRECKGCAAP